MTPTGRWEGWRPEAREVVVELLDARLVLHGRVGVVAAAGPVCRILTRLTVHEVETFGFGVPGLVVPVRERPRGGDAAVVLDFPEVLRPEPEQRGAVKLGVATHVVVLLGRELVALPVAPLLVGRVLPLQEDGGRIPVVALAGEVPTPLEEQDPLAGGRQLPGERPSTRSAADDDDVIVLVGRHCGAPYRPGLVCMRPPSVKTVVAVT
jgi:hypothetical protein